MRVNPITPAVAAKQRPRRAFMSISSQGGGKTVYTVIDTVTGEKHVLPAEKAWALHAELSKKQEGK